MLATFLVTWAVLLAGGAVLWAWSLKSRDVSIVDVFWGPAFVVSAWLYAALSDVPRDAAHLALLATVTLWGLRLAVHIAVRRRGHGEDRRYREMRQRAGERFASRSLVTIFWLQATLAALLAAPFLLTLASPDPGGWGPRGAGSWNSGLLQTAGLAVWAIGFLFEATADAQLLRFQRDPTNRGKVMDRGLWRFSRHPNYFGESVLWWGWALFGLGTAAGPWGLLPALAMTLLLVKGSGVPLVEKGAESRRPGYRDYVERTSSFVPLPPRQAATRSRG
jgi:steroid 5-alpha reductase family enzyme